MPNPGVTNFDSMARCSQKALPIPVPLRLQKTDKCVELPSVEFSRSVEGDPHSQQACSTASQLSPWENHPPQQARLGPTPLA